MGFPGRPIFIKYDQNRSDSLTLPALTIQAGAGLRSPLLETSTRSDPAMRARSKRVRIMREDLQGARRRRLRGFKVRRAHPSEDKDLRSAGLECEERNDSSYELNQEGGPLIIYIPMGARKTRGCQLQSYLCERRGAPKPPKSRFCVVFSLISLLPASSSPHTLSPANLNPYQDPCQKQNCQNPC